MKLYQCPNCGQDYNSYDVGYFFNEDEKEDFDGKPICQSCGHELMNLVSI